MAVWVSLEAINMQGQKNKKKTPVMKGFTAHNQEQKNNNNEHTPIYLLYQFK